LVNWPGESVCKRCGSPLASAGVYDPPTSFRRRPNGSDRKSFWSNHLNVLGLAVPICWLLVLVRDAIGAEVGGLLGWGMLLFGLGTAIVGGFWLLITMFRSGLLWGILGFLFPVVSLLFLLVHWGDARRPFLTNLCGALIAGAGFVLTGGEVRG